ncbi:Smr/MutS family protein [Candidatus Rariloculus sp.]|uniref:Smr/MutS family protein n=1 Tax=Candidatus Rariloculus sp. TaxID=3101265 RepID=UPI003D120843
MIDEDDRRAFADATRDVRPAKRSDRVPVQSPRRAARAIHSRAAVLETLRESLDGSWSDFSAADIAFRRPPISETAFRRLSRGRFSIEGELDLHGLTRPEAKAALKDFVVECAERGLGCVRIVHGKGTRSGPGGPVLKYLVHHWLARWDLVLAFTSAVPRHGGSGAVYVLLRRR